MCDDVQAIRLHERITRGEALSETEYHDLREWYARQDTEEDFLLSGNASHDLDRLRAQVNGAVTELATVAQRIQALMTENEHLRHEVETLYSQLTKNSTVQSV